MARKILIIFAFIIAVFPFLGFSETTDISVTTTLSLFIAITLLLSRRPKMIPNKPADISPNDMPSPFVSKSHDIPVLHREDNSLNPKLDKESEEEVVIHVEKVNPEAVPSPITTLPRKRHTETKRASITTSRVAAEEIKVPQIEVKVPERRQRRNSPKVILAYEDQVQPADIPMKMETPSFEQKKTSFETQL